MRPLLIIVSLCLCFHLTWAQEGEQTWCDYGIGYYELDLPGAEDCSEGSFGVDANGNPFTNRISGNIYASFQPGISCSETSIHHSAPIPGQLVIAEKDDQIFSTLSDENGEFVFFIDTGIYTLKTVPMLPGLVPCSEPVTIHLATDNEEIEQDFIMDQLYDCNYLNVDVATPFLKRCSTNSYTVKVCNRGSVVQSAAQVYLKLDPYFTLLNAEPLPFQSVGDAFVFNLPELPVFACSTISLSVELDCSAVLGQTHCVEAWTNVDYDCGLADPFWDESDLQVFETCEADSIRFDIRNRGAGNMAQARGYRIFKNANVYDTGAFQLNAGDQISFRLPADGDTWRLEVDNDPVHPFTLAQSATNEGCSSLSFATGFYTQFPVEPLNPGITIDCEENKETFHPNEIQANPKGYSQNQYVKPNTRLTYKIRFQNTGSDTVSTVVVRDTIPETLDISTLRMGVSSHTYQYEIIRGRILRVLFSNIQLPDSTINETTSHGYFKYEIDQQRDLPIGTRIENAAAIYLDFNEPILTNTYFHEVDDGLLFPVNVEEIQSQINDIEVRIQPNPFQNQTRIKVEGARYPELEFWVYDALGRRADFQQFTGNQLDYQQHHLPKGLYVYEIRSKGQRLQSGKLMVQ